MARFVVRGDQGGEAATFQRMNWEEKLALRQTAAMLGISPSHLASAMLFEMAANPTKTQGIVFNPNIKNPESSATGAIQFIKSNWEWTGFKPGMSFLDQIKPFGPVHTFLYVNGVRPGMGFEQVYRTIHTGNPRGNLKDAASGKMTSQIWPEAWNSWKHKGVEVLYEMDPTTNKLYLPLLPPLPDPPPKPIAVAADGSPIPTPPLRGYGRETELAMLERELAPEPQVAWTQVPELTQPEKRTVIPAVVPIEPRSKTPVPIEYRAVTRERDREIDIGEAIQKMIRPKPGRPPTWEEIEAVRLHGFDMRMLTSGMGTKETGLSLERFEEPLSEDEIDELTRTEPSALSGGSGGDFSGRVDNLTRRIDVPLPRRPVNQPISGSASRDSFSGKAEQMRERIPTRLRVTAEAGQLKGAESAIRLRIGPPEPRPRPPSEIDKLTEGLSRVEATGGPFRTQVRSRPEIPPPTGLPVKPFESAVATRSEVPPSTGFPPARLQTQVMSRPEVPPPSPQRARIEVKSRPEIPPPQPQRPPPVVAGRPDVPAPTGLPAAPPLPGAETQTGPAIASPQPGAVTGTDQPTRLAPRPGLYPQEDTLRPSVERAPEVASGSQMVMGIGVPEREASVAEPKTSPGFVTSEAVPLPDEIPPESVPGSVPVPAEVTSPPPVSPSTPPTTIQPRPTLPVQLPSQPGTSPSTQPSQMFPTAERRLAPAGNVLTSPVVQGSSAIANSPSGGSGHSYQTSVSPSGDGMVSWVRSDGSVITAYQDPSKGAGPIQGAATMPVKTSSTSFSLKPSGATIW